MPSIAVLTGDLVASTRTRSPGTFIDRLSLVLSEVEQALAARTEIFRGDSFQVTLADPGKAVRCALYIRAGLIAASPAKSDRWDARIAVAIGADRGRGDPYGDAYIESGRGLDALTRERLYLYAQPPIFQLATGIATAFADDIICQWTPSEAEAYYAYLQYPEGHQAVADALGKSRSTITKSLLRARYNLIERYVETVNKLMEETRVA